MKSLLQIASTRVTIGDRQGTLKTYLLEISDTSSTGRIDTPSVYVFHVYSVPDPSRVWLPPDAFTVVERHEGQTLLSYLLSNGIRGKALNTARGLRP